MSQKDLVDRFNREVDQLLHEAGRTDPTPTSGDYDELLEVAHLLAEADFSRQSKIRHSLRRRLLNRIDQTPATTAEIPGPLGLVKQIFQPDRSQSWPPARRRRNKFALATLAGLIVVFSFIALASNLQARQQLVDLLARVLAYLPVEEQIEPHTLWLRWQFRGEDGINSPPVATDGVIYAGSNAGYLYALDGRSGEELWRFETSGGVSLAPAVAGETVYAVSDEGHLYALDRQTGREQWRFDTAGRFTFGPTIAGNLVLVGADDGYLYALEAGAPREQWQFKAQSGILPQTTVAGDTLYVGSQDHHLYALELDTGREKWRFDAGDWISTEPVEVAGLVYLGSYDEHLYVIEADTGREVQRHNLGNKVRTSATLAGDTIYFGSYDSYLHAVDGPTGQEKWRFKMGKQIRSAPVVVSGVVYIGSGDGNLYEVNARTGAEIARYGVDSQIYSTPAVLGDTIYFVSGKGDLYAVQKTPLPSGEEQPVTAATATTEPAGFQFTPGGWYAVGQDEVIRFRGRLVDGAGRPVNGFSIQADNGSGSFLSPPAGANRWQPQAEAGEWEIVIPDAERNAGWWWLTAVQAECVADESGFDPQCQEFTRLSESVKVEIVYPAETVINADWTCQWDCGQGEEEYR